ECLLCPAWPSAHGRAIRLIRRTAGCGPACPVVWQGRRGDPPPYADCVPIQSRVKNHWLDVNFKTSHPGQSERGYSFLQPILAVGDTNLDKSCKLQYTYHDLRSSTGMNVKLGEKIRYLREVEGSLRGLGRPMTQLEIVRAIREEMGRGKGISQSYLSQIENGSRPHMTQSSRALLAKFFKVHPGFLVDDPEGYHTELTSDLRTTEGKLDVWLLQGSERFAGDRELSNVLIKAAREKDTRRCFLLLGAILDTPGLAERLLEALRPELPSAGNHQRTEGRRIR
ncbi:MAG TPA: helix-turn-helix domain-containing protein, partial [Candidatus Sulfotelmatobacter sp.]|nr:helix-turn-helix domain-containing protein [Candidatus Sulfotelmatobacter sp.]